MEDITLATEEESQVVESRMLEFVAIRLVVSIFPKQPAIDKD